MSTKSLFFRLALVISASAFWLPSADGQFIDYARLDIGPITQRLEPGYTAVGTAAAGVNGTNLAATPFVSLTGDAFTIAIDNMTDAGAPNGNIDWRDRGDSTSAEPLVQLGEDFIKNNAGSIRLTLGGLQAGQYRFTSFHLDPDNVQSAVIEVRVTDANGTAVLQSDTGDASANIPGANTAEQVNNITTAFVQNSSATFDVTSNGTSDVLVFFQGTGGDVETPFNGLTMLVVPEPSSALLLALGGLAVARRRRSR